MCGTSMILMCVCVCVCARARARAGLYTLPQEYARRLLYSHRLNVVCPVCLFADVSGSVAAPQTALTLMLIAEN